MAVASFNQSEEESGGNLLLKYKKGETIIIVSANIDNTYWVFGFKETEATLKREITSVEVCSLESTTVKPKYSIYPPGNRVYDISAWEDVGIDYNKDVDANLDMINFTSYTVLKHGEANILQEMYVSIFDFNPD